MQKATSKALYAYWNALRGSRSAPDRRDIDPTRIRNALATTFILETDDDATFNFRLAGSHICSTYCRELKGRSFTGMWQEKDIDAVNTMIRAVTEDNAVALVTFSGTTEVGGQATFETLLMPLRHKGTTRNRILGGLTAIDEPYWFGTQAINEQKITGLRLIWPDDQAAHSDIGHELPQAAVAEAGASAAAAPLSVQLFGNAARRYAHLAVIDGGRN